MVNWDKSVDLLIAATAVAAELPLDRQFASGARRRRVP